MRSSGMQRLQRALSAIKLAEMAKLGAEKRLAATARAEAAELRSESRRLSARQDGAAVLLQQSRWQAALELRAREADEKARAADRAAEPLSAQLSRTLGREGVTAELIDRARIEERQVADRRAEGVPVSRPAADTKS